MSARGTENLGMTWKEKAMTRNENLMTRHRKSRSNQIASRGTMRVNTESFAQVMKEQEHNLFAQSVRGMTGVQYITSEKDQNRTTALLVCVFLPERIVPHGGGRWHVWNGVP